MSETKLPVPKEALPAHLRALTPLQCRFVIAYVENANNASQAAITAGYDCGENDKYARQHGYTILKSVAVQEAVRLETQRLACNFAPQAFHVLVNLMSDPDPKVRMGATKEILDRTGFVKGRKIEHEHKVKYEDESEAVLRNRLAALKLKLGLPDDMEIVDVTPVEVDPNRRMTAVEALAKYDADHPRSEPTEVPVEVANAELPTLGDMLKDYLEDVNQD